MKSINHAVIAACACFVLAGAAFAADEAASGGEAPAFSDLDKNKDGMLDAAEVSSVTVIMFDTADTDADKKLSQSEYEAAAAKAKSGAEGEKK